MSSSEIASAEKIPSKFLESILTQLKSSGLVNVERGKNGGYQLNGEADDISMLSIVEATSGVVKPVNCVEKPAICDLGDSCLPRIFWVGLKETIDSYLGGKTLKDIIL